MPRTHVHANLAGEPGAGRGSITQTDTSYGSAVVYFRMLLPKYVTSTSTEAEYVAFSGSPKFEVQPAQIRIELTTNNGQP